jgi:hypothetical protein
MILNPVADLFAQSDLPAQRFKRSPDVLWCPGIRADALVAKVAP